jgi:hypothetical protein
MNVRNLASWLKSLYDRRIPYIDRVRIWLKTDRDIFSQPLKDKIARSFPCRTGKMLVETKEMSCFQPEYQQLIELYQPNQAVLKLVMDAVDKDMCGYMINYVELAMDWIPTDEDSRKKLSQFIRMHTVLRYKRNFENTSYDNKGGTGDYFGEPDNNEILGVYYDDRGCKMLDNDEDEEEFKKSCCHLEYRLKNKEYCTKSGIFSLGQLHDFDITAHFRKNATFMMQPTKEEIGHEINRCENGAITSRQGLIKRCDRFLAERFDDKLILNQELLSIYPELYQVMLNRGTSFQEAAIKGLLG